MFPTVFVVPTHASAENSVNVLGVFNNNLSEVDVGTDELLEFIRRDFSEPLESGDFDIAAEFLGFLVAFLLGVAVECGLGVADTEKGCLENIKMPGKDKLHEILEKESKQEIANVKPIDISVSRNNDFCVS